MTENAETSQRRLESYKRYGKKRRENPAYLADQKRRAAESYNRRKNDPSYKEAQRLRTALRLQDPAEKVKAAARRRVRTEIEAGRLTREPCLVCGSARTDAHHEDYGRPLDVMWFCRTHHKEHHLRATNPKGQPNV